MLTELLITRIPQTRKCPWLQEVENESHFCSIHIFAQPFPSAAKTVW